MKLFMCKKFKQKALSPNEKASQVSKNFNKKFDKIQRGCV